MTDDTKLAAALPAAREPGAYWIKRPGEDWRVAQLGRIEGGTLIEGVPIVEDVLETWALTGHPWAIGDTTGWEIGPRIPSPPAPDELRALSARLAELSAKAMCGTLTIDRGGTIRSSRDGLIPVAVCSYEHHETGELMVALVNAFRAGHLHAGPASDEGWNAAIEAAEQAVIELIHPNNRHHGMQDLRASNVRETIRAQRRPPQPSEGGES